MDARSRGHIRELDGPEGRAELASGLGASDAAAGLARALQIPSRVSAKCLQERSKVVVCSLPTR